MATQSEIERLVVRLTGDGVEYLRMLREAQLATQQFSQNVETSIDKAAKAFTGLGASVATPLALIGKLSLTEFAKFDQAMTESTSVIGKLTDQQSKDMRQLALDFSTVAKQGPTELAKSYYHLASAGLSAEQSMSILPLVASFATAGAFDLETATNLAAGAQNALGINSANAAENVQQLTRVMDVLVKSNELAIGNVQEFSTALTTKSAASFRAFHKDVEETTAVLATFAKQNVRGSVAGHAAARVVRTLAQAAVKEPQAYQQLNIKVFETEGPNVGKMRHIADVVEDLTKALGGMSDEMRTAALMALGFEARIQGDVLPLLGMSKVMRGLDAELRKAGGSMQQMADKQMRSFSNQMQVMRNHISIVAITIGEHLAPAFVEMNRAIQDTVKWFNSIDPSIKRVWTFTVALVTAFTGLAASLAVARSLFQTLFGGVSYIAGAVLGAIIGISIAIARYVESAGGIAPVFEDIRNKVSQFRAYIKPTTDIIVKWFWIAWEAIKFGSQLAWGTAKDVTARFITWVQSAIGPVAAAFVKFWDSIKEPVGQVVTFLLKEFQVFATMMLLIFVPVIENTVKLFMNLGEVGAQVFGVLKSLIPDTFSTSGLGEFLNDIRGTLSGLGLLGVTVVRVYSYYLTFYYTLKLLKGIYISIGIQQFVIATAMQVWNAALIAANIIMVVFNANLAIYNFIMNSSLVAMLAWIGEVTIMTVVTLAWNAVLLVGQGIMAAWNFVTGVGVAIIIAYVTQSTLATIQTVALGAAVNLCAIAVSAWHAVQTTLNALIGLSVVGVTVWHATITALNTVIGLGVVGTIIWNATIATGAAIIAGWNATLAAVIPLFGLLNFQLNLGVVTTAAWNALVAIGNGIMAVWNGLVVVMTGVMAAWEVVVITTQAAVMSLNTANLLGVSIILAYTTGVASAAIQTAFFNTVTSISTGVVYLWNTAVSTAIGITAAWNAAFLAFEAAAISFSVSFIIIFHAFIDSVTLLDIYLTAQIPIVLSNAASYVLLNATLLYTNVTLGIWYTLVSLSTTAMMALQSVNLTTIATFASYIVEVTIATVQTTLWNVALSISTGIMSVWNSISLLGVSIIAAYVIQTSLAAAQTVFWNTVTAVSNTLTTAYNTAVATLTTTLGLSALGTAVWHGAITVLNAVMGLAIIGTAVWQATVATTTAILGLFNLEVFGAYVELLGLVLVVGIGNAYFATLNTLIAAGQGIVAGWNAVLGLSVFVTATWNAALIQVNTAYVFLRSQLTITNALYVLSAIRVGVLAVAEATWYGIVAVGNGILAVRDGLMFVLSNLTGGWVITLIGATIAETAYNAAMAVANVLTGTFIANTVAAIATLAVFAAAIGAIGSVLYAAFMTMRSIYDLLTNLPTTFGPLKLLGDIFGSWYQVIKDIIAAVQYDMPMAWETAKAGFALMVAQIKAYWEPVWEFLKVGFSAVAEMAGKEFKLRIEQALRNIKLEGLILANKNIYGEDTSIAKEYKKEMEREDKFTEVQSRQMAREASKKIDDAMKGAKIPEKTKDIIEAENELKRLRAERLIGETISKGPFFDEEKNKAALGSLVKDAEDAGGDAGAALTKGFKDNLGLDNVLAGSAEAMRRIANFNDMLAPTRNTSVDTAYKLAEYGAGQNEKSRRAADKEWWTENPPTRTNLLDMNTPPDDMFKGRGSDRAVALLEKIADSLNSIKGKPPIEVAEAGLA